MVESRGLAAKSYDLKTGFDLSTARDRRTVEADLQKHRPDLLILSPPCTHEGGWFHLNSTRWERWEFLQKTAQSRSFIRWCCRLFRMQVALGGRAVFEHPTGSKMWSYAEVQSLCKKFTTVKLHMCRYGLQLPQSDRLIRKSTRLLASDEAMKELALLCPGSTEPQHVCHDVVKGSAPGVPSVSQFVGAYPPQFVFRLLETVPSLRQSAVLHVACDDVTTEQWEHVAAVARIRGHSEEELRAVVQKVHKNLGHPPNGDLVRILKHGQASEEALQIARQLECDFCKSQVKPGIPLPAQTHRVSEFNHRIGVDVKHLPGWRPNQKIRALNIVDQASSFQRMVPFFEQETSQVLRQLLVDSWIAWTGPPREIVLDPSRTNLGEPMVIPAELQGTQIRPIAAGAHWQLGKTESHGGWFEHVLEKLIEAHQPHDKASWLECVQHAHIKNQSIQVHGCSPHQFVFGKGLHLPEDLMNEPLAVVPATASLTEEGLARTQAMRVTARTALAQMQDDRAMRVALLARPRRPVDVQPGSLVAYWRDQKWVRGMLHQGGRWYGPAVVVGSVGRNVIVLHRRQLIRCAPEQIRASTEEEQTLVQTPQVELLGIKQMIEQDSLQSKSYIDLLPQSYPPSSDAGPAESEMAASPPRRTEPDPPVQSEPRRELETPPPLSAARPSESDSLNADVSTEDDPHQPSSGGPEQEPKHESSSSSSYGPIRRRIPGKDGPLTLTRPAAMQQEDFVDIMREVVPELIEQAVLSQPLDQSMNSNKRSHEEVTSTSSDAAEPSASRPRAHEVLSVQECSELLDLAESAPTEVFMAEYLKKKMSKEIPHSNNPPELQEMVNEGKRTEWQTLLSKPNALRLHYGKAAAKIKAERSDRFIGSRFVLTRKPLEEGREVDPADLNSFLVKGRWCLQGHLDPDLEAKAQEGLLKSPTLSQLGRMTLMQVIASKKWQLQLGDIKGAFLEAGPIDEKFRPLYAHQPAGGIPGVPPDAVIEILGNVYGQNDAPAAWFKEFVTFAQSAGWIQSRLDPCLMMLRSNEQIVGIMGLHVDDTAIGGFGSVFEESVKQLRTRFPYRKWRVGEGEFCGAWYKQAGDGSIEMCMSSFVDKIRPINVPKNSQSEDKLNPAQIKVLRAVNGSLNWLSSQSRPDLAVQTSLCQQSFPNPCMQDFRRANQAIRRAKQERQLGIRFCSIPVEDLTLVCHSDAAWANVGTHTQAGYVVAFTDSKLQEGHEVAWNPAAWKSYRLIRAVSSTLAAESQALSTASGTVEWLLLLLSEILDGPLNIRECRQVLQKRKPILVTDCKSLYDHLHSPSSPTSIEDRRTSIDVVIIRESCRAMKAFLRWVPTDRMLADAFTKDAGDPMDLLRSCLKRSRYQISPEATVLEHQALEKQHRLQRRKDRDEAS